MTSATVGGPPVGPGGSRSLPVGGAALAHAADKLIAKGRKIAARIHRPLHSNVVTPANSALLSASRRMASRTSAWLPSGNRTICRAAVGDSRPTRSSSRAVDPKRSISASRRPSLPC